MNIFSLSCSHFLGFIFSLLVLITFTGFELSDEKNILTLSERDAIQ